jgi:hypothetical protein
MIGTDKRPVFIRLLKSRRLGLSFKCSGTVLTQLFTRPLCTSEAFSARTETFVPIKTRAGFAMGAQTVSSANPRLRQALSWNASFAYFTYLC